LSFMRMLVMADTHGWLAGAKKAVLSHGPWDHVVHLGDSILDAVDLSAELKIDITAVRGNNEYPGSPDYHERLVFEAGGKRFLAIHGHELDLNPWSSGFEEGLAKLAEMARETGSDAVLFGHTHRPMVKEAEGILLVNPGGLGLGDNKPSFAEVTVKNEGRMEAKIVEIE